MAANTIEPRWWQSIRDLWTGTTSQPERLACFRRVTIEETKAYTLPRDISQIRVVRGGAWVSYQREDVVVYSGQTLKLLPDREGIVVTAIGRELAEIELYR
ncbi:MAG: hypothetical protein K8J31_10965 [Anaerolineae bacterium]|nr:hypothetical protein [Anaerolineae bacterium]